MFVYAQIWMSCTYLLLNGMDFNNFYFMGKEYIFVINHEYSPWSYIWINEVIHYCHHWHCGDGLPPWMMMRLEAIGLSNSNFISVSYLPSQAVVQDRSGCQYTFPCKTNLIPKKPRISLKLHGLDFHPKVFIFLEKMGPSLFHYIG